MMKRLWATAFLALCVVASNAQAADDPLPSWSDGTAKAALLQFIQVTTDSSSAKFVAPEERVATFDQDGTLWVEHPLYTQVVYCLDRVPAVVAKKPDLKSVEPFKTVLSGNREAIAISSCHRPPAARGFRQLDRRSANAGVRHDRQ